MYQESNQAKISKRLAEEKKLSKLPEKSFIHQLRKSFDIYGAVVNGRKTFTYKVPGNRLNMGMPDLMILGGIIPPGDVLFIEAKTIKMPSRTINLRRLLTDNQVATIQSIAETGAQIWVVTALGRFDAVAIHGKHLDAREVKQYVHTPHDHHPAIIHLHQERHNGQLMWKGLDSLLKIQP